MPTLRLLICAVLLAAVCANVAAINSARADDLRIFPDATRHEIVALPIGGGAKPAR